MSARLPPTENSNNPRPAPGWTTFESSGEQLAGPAARLGARVLDWVVIAVIGGVTAVIGIPRGLGGPEMFLLLPMVGFLYEVPLTAVRGQTLGKMALRIKVVGADNGLVPGWGRSIGRGMPLVAAVVPVAGWIGALLVYVSMLWDDRHQGWHDKAARTLVVRAGTMTSRALRGRGDPRQSRQRGRGGSVRWAKSQ